MTSSWPRVPLREVVRLRNPDVSVVPIESYQFAGVLSFGRGVFAGPIRRGDQFSYKRLTRLRSGDFVFPKLMAWEGAFGVVPPAFDGYLVSTEFPVFEVDVSRLIPGFLGWYFRSALSWKQVSGASTGTNVRRRRLHPDDFLAHAIPLPPLTDQRRTVTRLDDVDNAITEIKAVREALRREIRDLLLAAFRQISVTAPRRPMADVAPLVRRSIRVEPNASYAELGIRSFGKGTFHKATISGLDLGNKRIFRIEPGDLLFNNVFAWEGAIAVARPEDEGRVGSHRFITCLPKSEVVSASFLCFFFLTDEGLALIQAASPGGAGRNRTLGLEALARIEVPVPTIKAQQWFDGLLAEISRLNAVDAEAAVQLDTLLQPLLHHEFSRAWDP